MGTTVAATMARVYYYTPALQPLKGFCGWLFCCIFFRQLVLGNLYNQAVRLLALPVRLCCINLICLVRHSLVQGNGCIQTVFCSLPQCKIFGNLPVQGNIRLYLASGCICQHHMKLLGSQLLYLCGVLSLATLDAQLDAEPVSAILGIVFILKIIQLMAGCRLSPISRLNGQHHAKSH